MNDSITTDALAILRLERDKLLKENDELDRLLAGYAIELSKAVDLYSNAIRENQKFRVALGQYADPLNWMFNNRHEANDIFMPYGDGYEIAQEVLKNE